VHTLRVVQVPVAQVPSPPQGPTTCESVQGSASGSILPPQLRVSTHCLTSMHAAPPLQAESEVHSAMGAQKGPECAVEGRDPGGQLDGSGSTASA